MKKLLSFFLLFVSLPSYAYEIIRDPIFENYFNSFKETDEELNTVLLVDSNEPNAFVFGNKIYFTTELIKLIEDEDALKSIYYHELGHIKKKHFETRKIKNESNKGKKTLNNIFSIGLGILVQNADLVIASMLTLDKNLVNDLSRHSIRDEIQADDFMLNKIEKNNLNTNGLINFFKTLPDQKNHYFQSHPRASERINLLKKYSNNNKNKNSNTFEWIKAKYSMNSEIEEFNKFFLDLEMGINSEYEVSNMIKDSVIKYELYKKGFLVDQIDEIFLNLIEINNSSYLKLEFLNSILDFNLIEYYPTIEKQKHNKQIQKEYFYFFLIGKYYNLIDKVDLANFYFCQFYQLSKSLDKSNYYCKNYDITAIPEIDTSYALFK